MTTSVKVSAHCSSDKEVMVVVQENGAYVEVFTLQDGETADRVVFGNREVVVREQLKG